MYNGLETLVINTYDIVSYVIWDIPTLPSSVVGEGNLWKGYFPHLRNPFTEWNHNCFLAISKLSFCDAESHSELRAS